MTIDEEDTGFYGTVLVARALVRWGQTAGLDSSDLLRSSGLTQQMLDSPNGVVGLEILERLLEEVRERTNDPLVSLHAMNDVGPHDAGLVGYNVIARERAAEILMMAQENLRRVSNLFEFELSLAEPMAYFRVIPNIPVQRAAPWAEVIFLGHVRNNQRIIDPEHVPLHIKLMHEPLGDEAEYERVFECPVYFSQEHYEMGFDPSFGSARSRSHDPKLLEAIAPFVELDYAASPPPSGGATRAAVGIEVRKLLHGEVPSFEEVSQALGMRPRTLQHRLGQEGTSYREVLEETRRDIALAALRSGMNTERVAQQVGYGDIAAFYRAFRRWTGTTPGAFLATDGSSRKD